MIKREKDEKPTTRVPGPKSRRPVIPESFQISRTISPMRQILNEAEGRNASEPSPIPEQSAFDSPDSLAEKSPVDITGPLKTTSPAISTSPIKTTSPLNSKSPVVSTSPVKNLSKALQIT